MTHPASPDDPRPGTPPPGCPAHSPASATPLYGPEFAADPGAVYARLRAYGPAAPVRLAPDVDAMLVTSYAAALQVLRGTETFGKDARRWRALAEGTVAPDNPVVPMMAYRPNALFSEGDAHRRLRGAIDDCLRAVDPDALRGYVEHSADALIDAFGPVGEANLLDDYAKHLPLRVLNQMFGCPADLGDRLYTGMRGIFDGIDAEKCDALITEALIELIALKRRRPGGDMVSRLLAHEARLTDEEMIHQLVVLMGASTEPQQNLIANGLRLLLSDGRFAGDLGVGSLPVEDALDEVLWTDPPMANYGVHYAFHDVELDGVPLREGVPVVVSFAAATTDPALATDRRSGNRAHLAWSAGPHGCPAQREARIIASVALERLLDRLPDLELAVPADELTWRPGPFHRALAALPVRFPPVTGVRVPLPAEVPMPEAAPRTTTPRTALPKEPPTASPASPETPGDVPWTSSQARPNPPLTSSTPQAPTSPARPGGSPSAGRRRGWNFLARWWRGR
ncbi:cytochrome P450 [Streptantibioticus parmotrematis]|uniref:cytochrome P450 n=1 Tax=Streptantibioticus parmotrematis TaxID=2873249 RepID=UPI0033F3C811